MNDAALIAKLDEQRSLWLDLQDGRRVQIRRPLETEFVDFRDGITVDHACKYVCGWDGFTDAHLLGPSIGSSDQRAFSQDLWSRVVRDNIDYASAVTTAIVESVAKHLNARDAAAKN